MCTYVCTCVCIHMYVYTFLFCPVENKCVYIHMCTHMCTWVYMCVYICFCIIQHFDNFLMISLMLFDDIAMLTCLVFSFHKYFKHIGCVIAYRVSPWTNFLLRRDNLSVLVFFPWLWFSFGLVYNLHYGV